MDRGSGLEFGEEAGDYTEFEDGVESDSFEIRIESFEF